MISIHALREEGDEPAGMFHNSLRISIHALREEGDLGLFDGLFPRWEFLSTPSARRATFYAYFYSIVPIYFYPRPPRGGRRIALPLLIYSPAISIHALREEGDP